MGNTAILLSGPTLRPLVVRIDAGESSLRLAGADGVASEIAWWRLYRVSDEGTTHRYQRLDQRNWELRVTSGSDQALLAHIGRRPIARILHPLRKLHLIKTIAGVLILGVALVEHFPPEWVAGWITPAMERRLIAEPIARMAPHRCSYPGGEAAMRALLVRLDPGIGRRVRIVGFDVGEFVVTSLPGETIAVTREALQGTDADVMAALLAHEIAHLRHGDPVVASVRHNGVIGIWGSLLEGGRADLRLKFSGLEERRADIEAIRILNEANVSAGPAAAMFEEMRIAVEQGKSYADAYRFFHYGIESRAGYWRAAADRQRGRFLPALDKDRSDALFNFCWDGPLPVGEGQIIRLPDVLPAPTPVPVPAPLPPSARFGEGGIRPDPTPPPSPAP